MGHDSCLWDDCSRRGDFCHDTPGFYYKVSLPGGGRDMACVQRCGLSVSAYPKDSGTDSAHCHPGSVPAALCLHLQNREGA